MSKRTKSIYTIEFKQSSAKLAVESDQPISKTAKELGINETTLYSWVNKLYPDRNQKNDTEQDLEAENKALRRENMRLKQEREILKKAAAYFVSDVK